MKIFLVHNLYQQPGGEDVVFQAEAKLLRSQGHEVVDFVEDNRRLNGVSPLKAAVNAVWSLEAYHKIRTLVREVKPDITHFHNTFLKISPAAYYACKETGVPVVQTLHNYRLVCPGALLMREGRACENCLAKAVPWPGVIHGCWRGSRAQTAVVAGMLTFHRLLKTWQEQVDCYIALTEFARRKFIEGGLPAEKIVVKPNFIEDTVSSGNYLNQQRHGAIFVGRLSAEKGIDTLLQAFRELPGVPLTIAGDGPLKERVIQAVQQFSHIRYAGRLSKKEVLELMQRSAFLVFPSVWYETFGITTIEAFASGLPVVASRLGAAAEIVADGKTGLLFNPGDAKDLAEKIRWAAQNPGKLTIMGKNARREYEEKYTAWRNSRMLMDIYHKVIEMNRKK